MPWHHLSLSVPMMLFYKCKVCLRTFVKYVPGPYTLAVHQPTTMGYLTVGPLAYQEVMMWNRGFYRPAFPKNY